MPGDTAEVSARPTTATLRTCQVDKTARNHHCDAAECAARAAADDRETSFMTEPTGQRRPSRSAPKAAELESGCAELPAGRAWCSAGRTDRACATARCACSRGTSDLRTNRLVRGRGERRSRPGLENRSVARALPHNALAA